MGEGTPLVVEDADRSAYDEKALFHLLNLAREKRLYRAAHGAERAKPVGRSLPDLVVAAERPSRPWRSARPTRRLLKTVLLKQFADRQLNVDPKVLEFLALNIDRSLAAAAAAVEAVDRVALATGRKISRQLVIEALARQIPTDERGP